MDTWTRIERSGFYPTAVERALRRALGQGEPLATLCQVDTGFDRGSVFRHLTVVSLTRRAIVQLHVDELDGGSANIATAVHRVADIAGYSTMEVFSDPEHADGLSELTIALDLKGARRLDMEPARCEDPNCMADHGYTGTSYPDDLTFRISAAAAGGTLGMDVSSHQQNVDWASAYAAGSRFAYVKATEGGYYANPYFGQQYNGSAQVGMVRGAYHFANPRTSSGADQARYFVQNGGAWTADGKTLPGLLDIEFNPYPAYGNTCYNMTPAQLTAWTRDFVDTYRSLTGRDPMVYTATSWWSQCVGSQQFGTLPLHLASYSTVVGAIPAGWSGYDIWQFTDSGPFVGDSNFFPGTVNDLKVLAKNPKAVHRNWSNGQDRAVEDRAAEDRTAQDSNVVTTATGSIDIRTGIGSYWNENRSFYGNPIGTEYTLTNGVYAQKFTNGKTIYWTNSHGSHWLVTNGGLDQKFRSDIARFRGLTTNEETRSDTIAVSFANGEGGYWSNAYGTHILNERGAIYATWRKAGMKGAPTTDEQNLGNGIIKQEFTGSTTYVWSAQTGTHRLHTGGAFYHRFLHTGGTWGAPVTDETATSTGAQVRFASGKVLLWSDAYGAYETNGNGAIFKHWEKNTARYGAARGDESYTNGVYYMDFERGTIRWTAQRGLY